MKKSWKLALISALLLSIMPVIIPMSDIVSSANSAPAFWLGVDGNGSIVLDKNCPLEVDNEMLVFRIEEFPQTYYSKEEQVEVMRKERLFLFFRAANSTRKPEFAAGLSSMAPQDSSPAVTAAIIFPKIMYLNRGSAV